MRKKILCGQDKCQYYHNGRGCLGCIHISPGLLVPHPDTHVYKLTKEVEQLQAEKERLRAEIQFLQETYVKDPPHKGGVA